MSRILVIFASSRPDGNTCRAVQAALAGRPADWVDLAHSDLTPYDYQHRNRDDAFAGIVARMVASDLTILASPVYWYTVTAHLKTFFDRFSDLLEFRSELLGRLRGCPVCLLGTGASDTLPPTFAEPVALTCAYLKMRYLGCCYLPAGGADRDAHEARAAAFVTEALAAAGTRPEPEKSTATVLPG